MDGYIIVNNLAGLLIVTSLLVIGVKNTRKAARLYAVQSFVLVLIFLTLAAMQGSSELCWWAGSAFLTKVIFVPVVMTYALGHLESQEELPGVLSPALLLLAAVIIIFIAYYAVSSVQLHLVDHLKPALAVSLGHFLLGLLCIVSQRNILKQIFGYCLMENGTHLTLALLANKAPEIVEIGIATDAVFAVIIMAILVRKIYHTLHTLDVRQLTDLKG